MSSERLREIERAYQVLGEVGSQYDGITVNAVAEIWAEEHLGMKKARKGSKGIDGTLPNGRKLQVKSKKAGAHSDAGTYIGLSKSSLDLADDLLIVFVDYDSCKVTRTVGPAPIAEVRKIGRGENQGARYHVSDILEIEGVVDDRISEIERAYQAPKEPKKVLSKYDATTVHAIATNWAEEHLGMEKARKGAKGIDGTLPNGNTLQVKSKRAGAHSDAGTYITLSESSLDLADDLLIVFVDYDTCKVTRTVGPASVAEVEQVGRKGKKETRYHVSDILKIEGVVDNPI